MQKLEQAGERTQVVSLLIKKLIVKFNKIKIKMSFNYEISETPTIELPGLGKQRKSYSHFFDIDKSKQPIIGLSLDLKPEEYWVNKFDNFNNSMIEKRLANARHDGVDLDLMFKSHLKSFGYGYNDMLNPSSVTKFTAYLVGL